MTKFKIIVYLLFISLANTFGQSLLSPDSAISIALKNNYNILVAHNESEIDKINNTLGNAGMLPTVSANGSSNYAQSNTIQKLSSGVENKYPSATTNSLNANVALNWTIFDGGKMFVTKNKLNEIESLGELLYKDQVLQTISNVTLAYYLVVKQKQQLVSIQQVINYNKERVKISETGYNSGLTSKAILLQAKIDLNVSYENAINQQYTINESKHALNLILARDSGINFEVIDSIPVNYEPNKQELEQKLYANNTSVLVSQKDVEIAKLSLREYNAARFPKLSVNTGFNALNTNNNFGTLLKNQSIGPSVGATLSIPLFQAGNNTRMVKVAKMQLLSAGFALDNIKLQVNIQLQNALQYYENQKQLYLLEKENSVLTKENLEISMQRFKVGQTTSLELRQAEQSYEDSLTRLLTFQYNVKTAETKLKQLLAAF